MDNEEDDYALLLYQRQGLIAISLTSYGDRLEIVHTMSPLMMTNDGLKVGAPKSLVVSKRGSPEETRNELPGVTQYWYWSQGIHFCINSNDRVEDIMIFPPQRPEAQTEKIALPGSLVAVEHQYKDTGQDAFIVGRLSNKSSGMLHGVRVGITLRDKAGRLVDVMFSELASLLPRTGMPFRIGVPHKGEWTSYLVDIQALDTLSLGAGTEADRVRWRERLSKNTRLVIVRPSNR
jgi:hypothetical protein